MPATPASSIEVDAAPVAALLGLHPVEFRKLMQSGKITTLCERGVGEDEGRIRATFYCRGKRARLILATDGTVLAREG
jgi:hypothetical protein